MGCVKAQIRHVPVADPRVVPPAVDEWSDYVVRTGRKMLLQGVELGDDGLDHRGRHALGPHLGVHGVAQHRAVDGGVAGPFAGNQGVGFAVLLKFDEAEMVGEVPAAGRASRDAVALQGAAQPRRPAGIPVIAASSSLLTSTQPSPSIGIVDRKVSRPVSARIVQPFASPSRHSARPGSRLR